MTASAEDLARLTVVQGQAQAYRDARRELMRLAEEQVDRDLASMEVALEESIMYALERNSLTAVAAAYTPAGTKTPNRAAIYRIRRKYEGELDESAPVIADVPFIWKPRQVTTVNGDIIVYDLHADLEGFGPDELSGAIRWVWLDGRLELDSEGTVYPATLWYKRALENFVQRNPYPGSS